MDPIKYGVKIEFRLVESIIKHALNIKCQQDIWKNEKDCDGLFFGKVWLTERKFICKYSGQKIINCIWTSHNHSFVFYPNNTRQVWIAMEIKFSDMMKTNVHVLICLQWQIGNVNYQVKWRITLVLVSQRTSSCCTRNDSEPANWYPRHQGKQWHPGSSTSSNLPKCSFTATVDWSTWTQPNAWPIFRL